MSVHIDPEQFRKEVGRYKDRFYIDPLPTCALAEADLEWMAPSVSTIKKASGKDWTQVALQRAADWIVRHQISFHGETVENVKSLLSQANSNTLGIASDRGTQLHKMFEFYADGLNPEDVALGSDAARYRRTVLRLLDKLQPKILLSEMTVMSRTHGYAGTADAIWEVGGAPVMVDYKTRGAKHAAYIEEAWQISGYAKADYYIGLDAHGNHVRVAMPVMTHGMVLSITPTSFRMYEVDVEKAFPGFVTLRHHWGDRQAGTSAVIAKPVEIAMSRDEWIRIRIDTVKDVDIAPLLACWPEGVPKPRHIEEYDDAMVDALIPALEQAEKVLDLPWPENDPAIAANKGKRKSKADPVPEVVEGITLDEGDLMPQAMEAIRYRYEQLAPNAQQWISDRVSEALAAGVPIRVAEMPTARRVFISRAMIITLERAIAGDVFITALAAAHDCEVEALTDVPVGKTLGLLSWEQAASFAALIGMARPKPDEKPKTTKDGTEIIVSPKGEAMPTKPKTTRSRKKA